MTYGLTGAVVRSDRGREICATEPATPSIAMADATSPSLDAAGVAAGKPESPPTSGERRRQATESRVAEISSLLSALEEAASEPQPVVRSAIVPAAMAPVTVAAQAPLVDDYENRLAQVRLGIASALFTALKYKHAATASHSLRVALGCSTWALYKRLDDETRDVVEVASLLHDVGKMAAPDAVLNKIPPLTAEEASPSAGYAEIGVHILACCCSAPRVLDAVRYAGMRFDGHGGGESVVRGDRLPLESRMIAIVDAFDALTSDLSRGAVRSRDEALRKLTAGAGTLYDPILVHQFIELLSQQQDGLTQQVAGRWLSELGKRQSELPWQLHAASEPPPREPKPSEGRLLFEQQLIDSMHDGVIFVDALGRIGLWSKGAERLTGVSSAAAVGRQFTPGLLDICNTAGRRLRDEACPVARSLSTVAQLRQRLEILGRQGEHVAVDLHAIPVLGPDGQLQGATVLLQDAQPEASLEVKCEALHAEVTKDPMTKAANRAEFDRMLALFIEAHQQAGMPCSLIMSDIDHFKKINDTFGHQAGDEAIITIANLLKQMCRSGDLVARYGGEEFAVLCADCSADDAVARAEQIRRKLAETPHACLGTRRLTASFGVAQLQPGDTPETLLGRSDRALLLAKEQGRNRVVQLGAPMAHQQQKKKSWWSFSGFRPQPLVEVVLSTAVPINVAIEKLRGFVTDQKARIISTRDKRVELEISMEGAGLQRRRGDRPAPFRVELEFSEERRARTNSVGHAAGVYARTMASVAIRPKRSRNRRRDEQMEHARLILQSLKAYLMAKEIDATTGEEREPVREGAR